MVGEVGGVKFGMPDCTQTVEFLIAEAGWGENEDPKPTGWCS